MPLNSLTTRTVAWAAVGALGAVALGAAALSQVGIAAADSATPSPSTSTAPGFPGDGHGRGDGPRGPGMGMGGPDHAAEEAALAKVLGLTADQLHTQLMAGKSLATIAKAQGAALQTVIDAIVAHEKTELADAVKAGRLTQAQADAMTKDLVARATDQVNRTPGAGGPGMRGPGGPGMGRGGPDHAAEEAALAKVLGLTADQLRTQLMAGKSLATIAKAQGVALQTVIDAIVTHEKTELAAAVKAGRLTQTQADAMTKDLVARATDQVNRTPGAGGPGMGGPGMGGPGMGGPAPSGAATASGTSA